MCDTIKKTILIMLLHLHTPNCTHTRLYNKNSDIIFHIRFAINTV